MLKSIRFLLLSVQLLSQIFGVIFDSSLGLDSHVKSLFCSSLSNPCFSVTAKAVNSPDLCCFEFFDKRIPKANIVSINKTHSQCSTPAFVIETPKRLFCVKQDEDWAVREFVKRAQ
uniref:Chemokine interleukin-8-like domain-containing protein n=1 Tax=Astatotilapia calliptera TaxID=8154 RepID=A0A3P8NP86_ASTCA